MKVTRGGVAALAAALALTGAAAGCGAKGESASSGTINVGAALPLTGAVASSGQTLRRGYELAVDDFNSHGGAGGKKVKLIVEDDKFDPATGRSVVQKLITQDHVKAILGTYGSGPGLAESQIAERYKVPNIQPEASAGEMVTRNYKYLFNTFRLIGSTEEQFVKFLQDVVKPKTAAVVYIDNSFANDGAKSFSELASKAGINVVQSVQVQSGASNFTAALSAVKATSPDVVHFIGYVPDEIVFLKGMRQLDLAPKVVFTQSGVAFDPSVKQALGQDQAWVTGMPDWFPGSPFKSANDVAQAYKDRYHEDAREEVIKSYQAAQILLAALKQTGGGTSEQITAALRKTDMDVVGGHVTFAKNGQATIGAVIAEELPEGPKAVYPPDLAQAEWQPFAAWNAR